MSRHQFFTSLIAGGVSQIVFFSAGAPPFWCFIGGCLGSLAGGIAYDIVESSTPK